MPRLLRLYEAPPQLAVDTVDPAELDPNCSKCKLGASSPKKCIGPVNNGGGGGLLVVSEAPTRADLARPYSSSPGNLVATLVRKFWSGPFTLDYAVRCTPGQDGLSNEKPVRECRPFLADVVNTVKPARIITLGGAGSVGVLGRNPAAFQMRRVFSFRPHADGVTPVFSLMSPLAPTRNRIMREWFTTDFEWACTAKPEHPPWTAGVRVIESAEESDYAVAALRRCGTAVSIDAEWAGLTFTPSFRFLSLAATPRGSNDSFVWPEHILNDPVAARSLRAWLEDPKAPKGGANIKADTVGMFAAFGIWLRGVTFDTRLYRKLLVPGSSANLSHMSGLIGMGGAKEEAADIEAEGVTAAQKIINAEKRRERKLAELTANLAPGTKRKGKLPEPPPALSTLGINPELEACVRDDHVDTGAWSKALLPKDVLHRYNARDTVATALLADSLEAQLAEPTNASVAHVWRNVVLPASDAVAQVEAWGIAADRDALESFDRYLAVRFADYENQLSGYYRDVNWGSTDQLREILFEKLGLPVVKLTKGGDEATNKKALALLAHRHPIVPLIIERNHIRHLRSTYATGLRPHIRGDGRIHPSILLDGAETGRTSCVDPNLQNIPRASTAEGKLARDIFVSSPGRVFVQFDYSQLELRIAAMLSGDPVMIAIFQSGVDFHQRTAEMVSKIAWGIEPDKVTSEHRSLAKAINFGILYGKTARTFAKDFKISVEAAQKIIDAILGKFVVLAKWCRERLAETRKTGLSYTWWDGKLARRRQLWQIADMDDGIRSNAENGAVNTPVQGTASEFCVASLTECVRWIREDGLRTKLVLPVHDSLLFDVPEDEVEEVSWKVRQIMTSWNSNGMPLVVDEERGLSWGSLKKVKKAA